VTSTGLLEIHKESSYWWRKLENFQKTMFVVYGGVLTTFNNISVISWRSVLLVEKTGVPGENHRPVASH